MSAYRQSNGIDPAFDYYCLRLQAVEKGRPYTFKNYWNGPETFETVIGQTRLEADFLLIGPLGQYDPVFSHLSMNLHVKKLEELRTPEALNQIGLEELGKFPIVSRRGPAKAALFKVQKP